MIAKARERDALRRAHGWRRRRELSATACASFDLIVAADVLVYVGDLGPLFAIVETALTADGLFAFSVEACEGDGSSSSRRCGLPTAGPMSRRRPARPACGPFSSSPLRPGAKRARTRRV